MTRPTKYESVDRLLSDAGLAWYEISNWARPGHECRHNQLYWAQGSVSRHSAAQLTLTLPTRVVLADGGTFGRPNAISVSWGKDWNPRPVARTLTMGPAAARRCSFPCEPEAEFRRKRWRGGPTILFCHPWWKEVRPGD